MINSMRGRANGSTKHHHDRARSEGHAQQDSNRGFKQAIGTIAEIDPRGENRLLVTAFVPTANGGRRLWGGGRSGISLLDSPLDILQRFGGLRPGMIILITWRGISETGKAYARILSEGSTDETIRNGDKIPDRNVDTQSSLPFEPFGI